MSTAQQNGALATRADWTMAEMVYDVWQPLLHRKPTMAVEMAGEMQLLARRYAEQHMPDIAERLWPDEKQKASTRESGLHTTDPGDRLSPGRQGVEGSDQ